MGCAKHEPPIVSGAPEERLHRRTLCECMPALSLLGSSSCRQTGSRTGRHSFCVLASKINHVRSLGKQHFRSEDHTKVA